MAVAKKTILILLFMTFFLPRLSFGTAAEEGKPISGIGIGGNYPYVENKVRRYLTIRPSDIYTVKTVDDQIARLKEFYEREGWIGTEITVRPEPIENTDSIYLHFKIVRGHLLRYDRVYVTGNYSLPKSLVESKINILKPYTQRRLRDAIHKIISVYRSNGYPLAKVRLASTEIDDERKRISVTINIDEGPHVSIDFSGNKHIGGLQLKKVLTIFKEGAIDTFEIEESVKTIKRRYLERGFPNAAVKYERREIDSSHMSIIFIIDEGTPERIRKIDFIGNEKIGENRLKGKIESKELSLTEHGIYDPKVLDADTRRLDRFYSEQGFPEAKTSTPVVEKIYGGTQLLIDMPVDEGKQYLVKDIAFRGDVFFKKKRLRKIIKSRIDKPLNFSELEEEKQYLKSFYADNGYPYTEIELTIDKEPEQGSATLTFTIKSGPAVTFGEISFLGDFITSQKAIRNAITFKKGDPFSYEKLIASKVNLRRLSSFATVDLKTEGIGEKATIIPVTIKVEEMRPFKLDLDLGFSTDENFVGGLIFQDINTFGWAKTTTLKLIGGEKYSKGEISWLDPNLAGSDIEMTTSGWLQYENQSVFTYIEPGGGIGFARRYHRTSFGVTTNLTRNYFVKGSSTAADAQSLRDNTISNTLLWASFDTRNNFADPLKGIYVYGYSNFINEIKGANAHFVKLGAISGQYFTIFKRLTVANDERFENIQTYTKDVSIPSNELYLLGGDDSIRGFDRDSLGPVNIIGRPTGGRHRFVMNNELRLGLFGNFKGILFHDLGYLTNSYDAVTLDSIRQSVGFGLHYITPLGPIKADYGIILDRKPSEHFGRFHLTFGYIF